MSVDHKTRLQEFLQARFGCTPVYVQAEAEGPTTSVSTRSRSISPEGHRLRAGSDEKSSGQEAACQGLAALGQ